MAGRAGSSARVRGDGAEAPRSPPQNLLLSKLPSHELDLLMEHAEHVKKTIREVFFETGDRIDTVLFPLTGLASLLTDLTDKPVEAMTVGCEGFVGLPLFHGVETHRFRGLCQVDGEFLEMSAKSFVGVLEKAPALRRILHRYSQFTTEVLSQSAACNSSHMVEQRLARWLLTTADSVGTNQFNLTQEFLSQMLAVRRPGVTVAMGALERASLISHRYGGVTILDVAGLKKASCECYKRISDAARELLGTIQVTESLAPR